MRHGAATHAQCASAPPAISPANAADLCFWEGSVLTPQSRDAWPDPRRASFKLSALRRLSRAASAFAGFFFPSLDAVEAEGSLPVSRLKACFR